MSDILKVHSKVCPNFQGKNLQASLDGVSEAKSNSVSLDVYSSKFRGCRSIYAHRIVRPLKKGYVDNREQLNKVLLDYGDNNITIDAFVGDNPKRSFLKFCLNHSSLFPCEYCFAKEAKCMWKKKENDGSLEKTKTALIDKIKRIELEKGHKSEEALKVLKKLLTDLEKRQATKCRQITVWPSNTANQPLRTKQNIIDIVSLIEETQENEDSDPLTPDQLKGVVGHSMLLDLDYFDFVNNVPPEYMHLVCLGVVKRLTELTFNVGLNRPRITNRKLSSTKLFNYLMSLTKSTYEFSRRSRDLDFAVYKAEEFRNLILFFFPHVLQCVEKNAKERAIWLYLAFMIRACTLPDNEYFNVNVNEISSSGQKFYTLYEKVFGVSNCTYSTHVVGSHMPQIRQLGPLTETSAFKFETFYGEIRNSFTPGTPSSLKQIFENVMLKRSLGGHSCEKSIHISNYDTSLQCNSLVYTYDNDNVNIYKIIDIVDEVAICHEQGKYTCTFDETPELCWSSVGVFNTGALSTETVNIPQNAIAGKALKVGSYLITCPENVLKEK